MQQNSMPIGVVEMTSDQYHKEAPGYSCSHVKKFAQGALDYVDEYIDPPKPLNPDEEPPTLAEQWVDNVDLDIGTAIHTAVLEPDLLAQSIIVMPGLNLRTKDGRAMRDEILAKNYPQKLVLRPEDFELVKRCRDAVHKHPIARELFRHGRAEESVFAIDPDTGALLKARKDWKNPHMGAVVDVKSCRDASRDGFRKDMMNLRYHFQPPWYQHVDEIHYGEPLPHWVWLCIQKGPKPRIGVWFEEPDDIAFAGAEVRAHFLRLHEMQQSGAWPRSYTDTEIEPLGRPAWHRRKT